MSLYKYMMLNMWFLMWYIANEEILSIGFNKKEESGMVATILDD